MTDATTVALFGDSGSGKTTQGGEWAKTKFKHTGKRTRLCAVDQGGYESLLPLVRKEVIRVEEFPHGGDIWTWINAASNGDFLKEDEGLLLVDSGTAVGELLLDACRSSDLNIGPQKTQRFQVNKDLRVSMNNETHYLLAQGFLTKALWNSTYLTQKGIDVMWTFSVLRGEEEDNTRILGPNLGVGKALTPKLPKWFRYCFRIEALPQEGSAPIHRLYLTEYPDRAGLGHSFANARFPLDGGQLPPYIEPASIAEALRLIHEGQEQADRVLEAELGL